MDGLLVSELARRSGVPATTLRFYEREGLLPAGRTTSGYRVYDDVAVDRLAFIATAKRLGLALPEIRLLVQPGVQPVRGVDLARDTIAGPAEHGAEQLLIAPGGEAPSAATPSRVGSHSGAASRSAP